MFGMRPLMTQYEYCQICADRYEEQGLIDLAQAYKSIMDKMTIKQAESWI